MSSNCRPADDWPPVSVIMAVLQEERHLREAVDHVLTQDYPGALELVIALGPSHDRTDAIATELAARDRRVRTVANPSGSTPAGLNRAIAGSRHEVIVRADGHAMLPRDYVRIAVELLRSTGAANVGGMMAAEGSNPFQQAVARAMTTKLGVGNAPFHTGGEAGPADTVYLGSFRRTALEAVGGYDESFRRAQDWELNFRLRRAGELVWFSPRLHVSYRPRASLSTLARQYFNYGRWRRVVMREHPESVSLRYLAPPVALIGIVAGVAAAPWSAWALLAPVGYVGVVMGGAVFTSRGLPPRAVGWLPLVYATMHLSWGTGFLSGVRGVVDARTGLPADVPPS
jgi:succinoglycan biosynthesis protein ExoA